MMSIRFPLSRLKSSRYWLATILALTAVPAWAGGASVLTQDNDNARTGSNTSETVLTPANVTTATFGKLFTRALDADVNGQVLYVPSVTINGAVHNVIYAYTSNNSNGSPCSLYAFDADDPNQSAPLWHTALTASAQWTTATPVIDPATKTMYVLTKDNNDSGPTNLRAFDITTGVEKTGSPITIAASVPGNGAGNVGGVVSFDTSHGNERPGLLLVNGVVYLGFAHNSDSPPYHGWVFGYKFTQPNGTAPGSFAQTAVFCVNPNGGDDGVWQAGKGLAADASGNIYFSVGNGTFDANSATAPNTDYGMCYVKLSTPSLAVADWFAPFDESGLSNSDLDTGNSGPVLIPGTDRIFGGGTKFGSVFLLDTANMGKFTSGGPDKAVQRFDNVTGHDEVGQNPIAWDSGTYKYVYLWAPGQEVQQYQYDPNSFNPTTNSNGQFNPAGIFKTTSGLTSGGSLAVTSNGTADGILWGIGRDHALHAFSATDVSQPELWNSNLNSGRDGFGSVGHFQFPTVVNGKAYVPTGSNQIVAYGLLPQTITPIADAFVRASTYANTNYGANPQLIVKRYSNDSSSIYNRVSYLKVDLTGVTAPPTSAKLNLTVNPVSTPSTSSETVKVYSVANTSWTETGITWNNAPGLNRTSFTSTGKYVTAVTVPLTSGTASFDVTAFVAAHLGKVATLQLIDTATDNLYLVFNSREAGSGQPQLVVNH